MVVSVRADAASEMVARLRREKLIREQVSSMKTWTRD